MSDSTIDGLKQRLVGAFVILSLAIIFLPMIFDKPHTVGSSSIVPVPPSPDVKSVVIRKPEKPVYKKVEIDPADNKVKTVDKIVERQSSKSEPVKIVAVEDSSNGDAKPKQSSVDQAPASKPVPSVTKASTSTRQKSEESLSSPKVSNLSVFKNVWMVQLGTFGNHQNAYKLRDRLRNDGFDGHTKDVVINGKKVVRVFTGPFVNKRVAEKTKKKVDDKYKVKSMLIYFDA